MTGVELYSVLREHPPQAVALATATQVLDEFPRPQRSYVLAVAWVLDATARWARGEAEVDEMKAMHAMAVEQAVIEERPDFGWSSVARVAGCWLDLGLADMAVYYLGLARSAGRLEGAGWAGRVRDELAARLPPPGNWGLWRQGRVLARAGDYLWRESEGRFITRSELTPEEAVDFDALEDRCG